VSKIAPQVGCPTGQVLIPAKLLVELKGHNGLVIDD
jgi:hypothetical protein